MLVILLLINISFLYGQLTCDKCRKTFPYQSKWLMHFSSKSHRLELEKNSKIEVLDGHKKIYKYQYKNMVFYSYNGLFKINSPQRLFKIRKSMKEAHDYKKNKLQNMLKSKTDVDIYNQSTKSTSQVKTHSMKTRNKIIDKAMEYDPYLKDISVDANFPALSEKIADTTPTYYKPITQIPASEFDTESTQPQHDPCLAITEVTPATDVTANDLYAYYYLSGHHRNSTSEWLNLLLSSENLFYK